MNLGFDHGIESESGFDYGVDTSQDSPKIPSGLGKGATVTLGFGESLTVTAIVDVAPEVGVIDATEYSAEYDREFGASLRRCGLIKLTCYHEVSDPTYRRIIELFISGEIETWRLWMPGGGWMLFDAFVYAHRLDKPIDNYVQSQFSLQPTGEFGIYG